jgi:type IV conjugative transfer system coupling protein TraD
MGKHDIIPFDDGLRTKRKNLLRNESNFTRGSQLVTADWRMTWQGIKVPIYIFLASFVLLFSISLNIKMADKETMLVIMKIYSISWTGLGFDPAKLIHLTLPSDRIMAIPIKQVPDVAAVLFAWNKAAQCFYGCLVIAMFITVPLTMWWVSYSRSRGRDMTTDTYERGAIMVSNAVLRATIVRHNRAEFDKECAAMEPPMTGKQVIALPEATRNKLKFHKPYLIANIPWPWRLEQTHAMLIGTTGTGKTTIQKSLLEQMRIRGGRAVVFDLTGSLTESFYNPETDHILNPFDKRCSRWTIFNDCTTYAEYMSAAKALIQGESGADPFWPSAAQNVFVETAIKVYESGIHSNKELAHKLMTADLSDLNALLKDTIAGPLTSLDAPKLAASIRAVLNTNAHVQRFLPEEGENFSIAKWIKGDFVEGSILFINSRHIDLATTRPLLTMWMNIAVNALMEQQRTRDLRTWFIFDEVHALHRLPAIENGLQTARSYGGAFVLGMHSYDKLAETYGAEGATNLASLARTKVILATADLETAKKCSEFIGSQDVREVDMAHSYGSATVRDATTLSAQRKTSALVMPDDLMNLPSMHGYVKFPDGFPAADILIKWKEYPEVAPAYIATDPLPMPKFRPDGSSDEVDESEEAAQSDSGLGQENPELPDIGKMNNSPEIIFNDNDVKDVHTKVGEGIETPQIDKQSVKDAEEAKQVASSNDEVRGANMKAGERSEELKDSIKTSLARPHKTGERQKSKGHNSRTSETHKTNPNNTKAKQSHHQNSAVMRELRADLGDGEENKNRAALSASLDRGLGD